MKNLLIVGGGSIGERHLRCFLATHRANVWLADISSEIRERLADKYEIQQVYESLNEALDSAPIDAAVICTPAHLHIPMALQLAAQGVGLLIEKPLSTSLDGVQALADLVESQGTPLSIAYVTRHHPGLAAIKAAVDAERFGKPVEILVNSGQHFPFYRPAYREIYYNDHRTGGGAIQDALTHMLNAAEWVVGPISRLVADAEHCVLPDVEVEDTVHVMTRHGSILGAFTLNQHQPANETTLTVVCERGVVRLNSTRGQWMSCDQPDQDWRVEAEYKLQRDDLFVFQANAFLDHLEGREAVCSLKEGLQTLKVNLAALESVKKGCWVTI